MCESMNTQNEVNETGCCPRFNPEEWDEKEITWTEKLFVKDKVRSVLHIPLNFGQVMVRNMEKIQKAGASAKETIVFPMKIPCGDRMNILQSKRTSQDLT